MLRPILHALVMEGVVRGEVVEVESIGGPWGKDGGGCLCFSNKGLDGAERVVLVMVVQDRR